MGSVCCCLHAEDDEYAPPNNSIYRHCLCLRCLTAQLLHAYTALFQRGEVHSIPSLQGTDVSAGLVADGSISDTYRSPPRPLAYDDPRCSHLQRGFVSRRDKGSSRVHEESEPLRRSNNDADTESMDMANKWNGSDNGGSKLYHSESSLKQPLGEVTSGVAYLFTSSEDEDVCPTCLEEYTPENPRIIMQCSHHFHLGCIYEWMERSEACPVCGKVMVFNETT